MGLGPGSFGGPLPSELNKSLLVMMVFMAIFNGISLVISGIQITHTALRSHTGKDSARRSRYQRVRHGRTLCHVWRDLSGFWKICFYGQ